VISEKQMGMLNHIDVDTNPMTVTRQSSANISDYYLEPWSITQRGSATLAPIASNQPCDWDLLRGGSFPLPKGSPAMFCILSGDGKRFRMQVTCDVSELCDVRLYPPD
jgi:hypothetical protein